MTHHAPVILTDPRILAAYAEGAGIYRIIPNAVAIPCDLDALRRVLLWARETGTPLVSRGAGSGMGGGSVGRGVVVDLTSFREQAPSWDARLLRVGAGVTCAEVNAAARRFGLRLAPDPSSCAFATSGGMAATNAAGPRSVRCGSVRQWIRALEVMEADGTVRTVERGDGSRRWRLSSAARDLVRHSFPRTRKSSSGYALDRYVETGDELDLLIGSEGTLAVITAVEWVLEAIPPDVGGVLLGFASLEALTEAVSYLVALNPSAVELLDATFLDLIRGAGADLPANLAGLLLVEFERETASAARGVVGDAVRGLKALTAHVETAIDRAGLARLWEVRRMASPALARLPERQRSLQVVEDGCVPLERLGAYVAGIRAAAGRRGVPVAIFGHAGDGHVHVNALPDITRPGWRDSLAGLFGDAVDLLIELGGVPSGEHGVGRLRAGVLERFYGPDVMALFRDLKRAYDPLGLLNPGVILPANDWAPLADLKVGADAAAIPADVADRLRAIERNASWAVPKVDLAALTPDT